MKKCNDSCFAICDFCIHYEDESKKNGSEEFSGYGICNIDNTEVSASDSCETNFHCFRVHLEEK